MLDSIGSELVTDWIAFYALEAETSDPNRPPTNDELMDKFRALAAASTARKGEVRREPRP
jgi:hypothetical protein